MRIVALAALLALAACNPQGRIDASVSAKERLVQAGMWARSAQNAATDAVQACRSEDSDRCRALLTSTAANSADYLQRRNVAEAEYLAACRKCAAEADCERDSQAMEQPTARTAPRWTPCLGTRAASDAQVIAP